MDSFSSNKKTVNAEWFFEYLTNFKLIVLPILFNFANHYA